MKVIGLRTAITIYIKTDGLIILLRGDGGTDQEENMDLLFNRGLRWQ